MNERRIAVDGVSTRVLSEGHGPAVVLLHGGALGCSADDWRRNVAPLAAAGVHALAFDQPGFGECDEPPEPALAYRERYLLGLLDALGIARANLVGHSQAGRLVLGAALRSPQRVASGTILCTGSLLPPLGERAPEIPPPTHEPSSAETRAYLESVVYDRGLVDDALVATYQRYSHGRQFRYARQRAQLTAGTSGGREGWEQLAEPTVPLMLVYGANDKGPVRERIALARARYPQLPIHLLEACGHFAQWDRPDDVVQLASGFARA